MVHLKPTDYRAMPWKNGQGTTTEIDVHPASGRFVWRLSIAAVGQSGPFSDFAGYERTIMLIEGKGMVLSFDAAPQQVVAVHFVPFAFPGEWKTQCRLIDGPVRDFNLMVERERASGSLDVLALSGAQTTHPLAADHHLLHCLHGAVELAAPGHRLTLCAGDTVRIDRTADTCTALSLRAVGANAAVASIAIRLRKELS